MSHNFTPLLIDGAVRQFCVHRYSTVQDMQDRLSAYDLSKNSVEINKDAPQWTSLGLLEFLSIGHEQEKIFGVIPGS